MTAHLFPTTSVPDLTNTTSGATRGLTFHCSVTGRSVIALGWYRGALFTTAPTWLALFDTVTGALLASAVPSAGSGAGWQYTTIDPVLISAGRSYALLRGEPNGFRLYAFSPTPATESPLVLDAGRGGGGATSIPTYITTADTNFGANSLILDDGENAPVTTGGLDTQLDNTLSGWLSTTDGTHIDSAPLQDHATLATVDTNLSDVKDQQNEWAFGLGAFAHGYYDLIRGLLQTVKDNTDALPEEVQDIVDVMVDHLDSEIGTILATVDDVLSNLGAQSTDLSGTAGSAVGALSGRSGFPATGWSMSAETDFTDNVLFDEPADAYVITITSYQPTQPATTTAAGLWLPRVGWWCVMNGSLASQRQFVDFEQMLLTDQGRRMPACAIELKPGTIAHVQAWLLA